MTKYNDDPFDRFDLKHLSASSINLFLSNLALFIVQYLHKFRPPTNAAMLRGNLSDRGVGHALGFDQDKDGNWVHNEYLYKSFNSAEVLASKLVKEFDQEMKDQDLTEDEQVKCDKEREDLSKYITTAAEFYRARTKVDDVLFGKPLAYQKKVKLDVGLGVPIIGFADLEFAESVRDIKTTTKMPSKLTPQISRQLSIYATALEKKRAAADFVVGRKSGFVVESIDCDDIQMHFDEVYRAAEAIQMLLYNNDIITLIQQTYPDFSDWRWDRYSKEEAIKLWRIK